MNTYENVIFFTCRFLWEFSINLERKFILLPLAATFHGIVRRVHARSVVLGSSPTVLEIACVRILHEKLHALQVFEFFFFFIFLRATLPQAVRLWNRL